MKPRLFQIRSPDHLTLLVGFWLLTVGNFVFWSHVASMVSLYVNFVFAASWMAVWFALTQLFMWPVVLKSWLSISLIAAATASYFMSTYGVVIDPSMMSNTFATNTHEAMDLISWRLIIFLLCMAVLPIAYISQLSIQWTWPWKTFFYRLSLSVVGTGCAIALIWTVYGDIASMMRNDRSIRYKIAPFNAFYSSVRALTPILHLKNRALIQVADDVQVSNYQRKPPLIVLVVGETARAKNIGLNGYERNTTPYMEGRLLRNELVYWQDVTSCGTSTVVSLPCIFSPLSALDGADRPALHENLLDILKKAGLAVYWIDNQSGCKGVCDRIHHQALYSNDDTIQCKNGECLDEVLVQQLDHAMNSMPSDEKKLGVVLVLHQMGSHGPAYFKRSSSKYKQFLPECTSAVLSDCTIESIRNSYDNSILYTDHVLELTIQWLGQQEQAQNFAPAMIYVSDHGESLGEKGLYLHGAPIWMAPREQTHIPLMAWYSRSLQESRELSIACLQKSSSAPINHDYFFHSILSLAGVKTHIYQPRLDWHSACMNN